MTLPFLHPRCPKLFLPLYWIFWLIYWIVRVIVKVVRWLISPITRTTTAESVKRHNVGRFD